MKSPLVVLVGRPNVGKSTLFNKIVGKRLAITSCAAGTTRDAVEGLVTWGDTHFRLFDTGGLVLDSKDLFCKFAEGQALSMIKMADVVVFVADVNSGVCVADENIAFLLKKSQRPVVFCVNKCDSIGSGDFGIYEFYKLGLGDPVAVSAIHGHGSGDLLDRVCAILKDDKFNNYELENPESVKVAIVGRPNAGKSSLANKICRRERCIVTEIPGTTRDTLDVFIKNEFGIYTFIDTAGIRKNKKVVDDVEKYSVIRAKLAVERSDVCLLLLDVANGYSEQDAKIVEIVEEAGKGCIVVLNKWDLVEKDSYTMNDYKERLSNSFSFVKYVPFLFISAKTGQRVSEIFPLVNKVYSSCNLRISTGVLNNFLVRCMAKVPPPTHKGKRLKIFYVTQASVAPPVFVFFVNSAKLFHFSYRRYIENQLRDSFDLLGAPVRFVVREKESYKSRL